MKFKLKGILSTAIAISFGMLVLLGYFFDLKYIRVELLNWAIILAAFAVLIGLCNLLIVHVNKIRHKEKGSIYSLLLVVSMLGTFMLAVILKPEHPAVVAVFSAVQLPVEASLMALLAVTLTYASFRLLRRRLNLFSIIFLVTALLILLGTAPLPFYGDIPGVSDFVRPFLAQVMAASGARGILLGVALGTLTTGLRVLLGADRPFGGKNNG